MAWGQLTITVPNTAPVVQTANITRSHNQTLALSSLFSVTDADGDAMTKYQLLDSTADSNSGHFVVNGVTQAANSVIEITAAQLAQTSFVTGKVGDNLQIRAFDDASWSAADNAAWAPFTISVTNAAPVVTTANIIAEPFPDFGAFQPVLGEGRRWRHHDPVSALGCDARSHQRSFRRQWRDSGRRHRDRPSMPRDLANTSFITGSVGDTLQIRAYDGMAWSAADNASWAPFTHHPCRIRRRW